MNHKHKTLHIPYTVAVKFPSSLMLHISSTLKATGQCLEDQRAKAVGT